MAAPGAVSTAIPSAHHRHGAHQPRSPSETQTQVGDAENGVRDPYLGGARMEHDAVLCLQPAQGVPDDARRRAELVGQLLERGRLAALDE